MELVWPSALYLPGYIHALQQGWSPDNLRPEAAQEELARIAEDPSRFLTEQVDREAKGPKVITPDGREVPRLPGYSRWMWDGEFSGVINFRWQPGTTDLPPYCLGHIGYSVVPWKRRRGYAILALKLLLPEAAREGLPFLQIVTNADNIASKRVIEANGGELIERFRKSEEYGGESLRYRIVLPRKFKGDDLSRRIHADKRIKNLVICAVPLNLLVRSVFIRAHPRLISISRLGSSRFRSDLKPT